MSRSIKKESMPRLSGNTVLTFRFNEVLSEINSLREITHNYIRPDSLHVLPYMIDQLKIIQTSATGRPYDWATEPNSPLRSVTSTGQYDPGREHGSHKAFAELSWKWQIEPLGDHHRRAARDRLFALTGIASTRVRLRDENIEEEEIAGWKMEIGDHASPGCHFHIQMNRKTDENWFPQSLPVPRFPSVVVTPMLAFEFVIAELFQDDWAKRAAEESYDLAQWRSIQVQRLTRLLEWQSREINDGTGTPAVRYKTIKPPSDLFSRK